MLPDIITDLCHLCITFLPPKISTSSWVYINSTLTLKNNSGGQNKFQALKLQMLVEKPRGFLDVFGARSTEDGYRGQQGKWLPPGPF